MQLNTYLNYGGNCAEAFKFYEQNLGGKITMMMKHGENPGESRVPADWKNAVCTRASALGERSLSVPTSPVISRCAALIFR